MASNSKNIAELLNTDTQINNTDVAVKCWYCNIKNLWFN